MDNEPKNIKERLLDLDALDAQAQEPQSSEAYHLVSSSKDYRLGVVVSVSPDGVLIHSIELLICLFSGHTELMVPQMERVLQLTKELKQKGYLIVHEDDGWVSCGRTLPRSEVCAECGALMNILMRFKADCKFEGQQQKME
jgi:hypothetical protein